MSPPKQPQSQNLQIYFDQDTSLTRSFKVFHSSLAKSAGKLWLKVLGKIIVPNFGVYLPCTGFKG